MIVDLNKIKLNKFEEIIKTKKGQKTKREIAVSREIKYGDQYSKFIELIETAKNSRER